MSGELTADETRSLLGLQPNTAAAYAPADERPFLFAIDAPLYLF
jgi:hypothetical protein